MYIGNVFCDNQGMAISLEIAATISEMSKPKGGERPSLPQCEPGLKPTLERTAKSDYYGARSKRKKCQNLLTLRKTGEIDSEAETMAERWLNDYQFSDFGYSDFMCAPIGPDYIKGDVHTFAVSRGLAGERVSLVREILGDASHALLVQVLFFDHSFAAVGRQLLPGTDDTTARKSIRQRALQLLQVLPGAYKTARKIQKDARQKSHN